MTILSGDIKIVQSQVMDDVDNGGGAPVATVILDGQSNGVFPDISEVDRAGGRLNLRKLFTSIQTQNTDGYYGANMIVAEPPLDPNVSVTLFSTKDVFDRRVSAQNRLESYLSRGPAYPGYLYGDHITGMRTVTLLQRLDAEIPVVGDTLVLRAFANQSNEVEQYIRVTDVSSVVRTFEDDQGVFQRLQVNLDISDALRADLPGFDAIRYDAAINYTGKTRTYQTIVADAARYYGVVPLENAASTGDYTIKGEGIFTQLVPSTRIEVPIADSRMNQQVRQLSDTEVAYSRTLALAFTTTQSLYIGGSIFPGSLSIVRGGIALTDKGGVLINQSGEQVGLIDYDNGVASLSTNIFGTSSGSHVVNYRWATTPTLVTDSVATPVTQAGQRLSYVYTFNTIPARGSLKVSYRALGRWYVLSDDGSGVLRGADASFGAGTVNFTTGTVSVTLGALPDVESSVVFTFAAASNVIPIQELIQSGPALARAFGKLVTVGEALKPGSVNITWNDGTARSSADASGVLTGDATGTVNYSDGTILIRPNLLPPKNTSATVTIDKHTATKGQRFNISDGGGSTWFFNIGAGVVPRTVELAMVGYFQQDDKFVTTSIRLFDNGSGALTFANITGNATAGTINYTTGDCVVNKTLSYNIVEGVQQWAIDPPVDGGFVGYSRRIVGQQLSPGQFIVTNGNGPTETLSVAWSWWGGAQVSAVEFRCSTGASSPDTYNFTFDSIFLPNNPYSYTESIGYTPSLTGMMLGNDVLVKNGVTWQRNPSPTTGLGTTVGADAILGGIPGVVLSEWTAGQASTPTKVVGMAAPAIDGLYSPLSVTQATLRTAVSPLVNGGFSVAANWIDTGALVTATANSAGEILSGSAPANADAYGSLGVFGLVNYEMGIATVVFGRRAGSNHYGDVDVIDMSPLGVAGLSLVQIKPVQADTLRYNAVGYSYIPLDADILGVDPVRLPADGRVPIFRKGGFAVIGHTGEISATVSNGQTINCGRTRLSRVRVVGNNGQVINSGYTVNLDAGLVTFTDITGYSQPVKVQHRIEDMALVSDAQINGQITFTRALTHDFPVGSFISSALVAGDLKAYVALSFDQGSWDGTTWSDTISGSPATGTYNEALNPIGVSNLGTLTERWAIRFVNTTSFEVIGEHVGVIATGNTGSDLAPLNPATNAPYFTLLSAGWGLGWGAGNIFRFNTVGAFYPMWVARTILQGPETVDDDSFTLLVRGDVDRP